VARLPLFQKDADFEAFERVLVLAMEKHPIRLLGYCLMPNHWHFVLWPQDDREMSNFLRWLTHTHTQRWHAQHLTAGTGHLYQGRFKAFPIQQDDHLYKVLRYVERNALRAGLVRKAQAWHWSSLAQRGRQDEDSMQALLQAWPVPLPDDWVQCVNGPETEAELQALRRSILRGQPFGSEKWQERVTKKLGLEHTIRRPGRPKKKSQSTDSG